eukprot:4798870-Pyramimonas_sp.AAC.1
MIHGPCGALNPQCSCMKDGLCTKWYPEPFRSETNINVDGCPEYRRRESTPPLIVKNGVLDTRSVVPYNPYLLELFDCHINVEVCTSLRPI